MQFDEKFDIKSWMERFPSFDFVAAINFLVFQEHADLKNTFINLSWIARHYVPPTVYKYISLDNQIDLNERKINTLEKQTIHFSSYEKLNDPFDCRSFYYTPIPEKPSSINSSGLRFTRELPGMVRLCCFTSCDVQSMPLWAHYTNNHQGFCVEYDLDNSINPYLRKLMYPVSYCDKRVDISSIINDQLLLSRKRVCNQTTSRENLISQSQLLTFVAIFLMNIKHPSWSYEHENRCIVSSNSPDIENFPAKPRCIYIGIQCLPQYTEKLYALGRKLGIHVFQMQFDEQNPDYKLIIK